MKPIFDETKKMVDEFDSCVISHVLSHEKDPRMVQRKGNTLADLLATTAKVEKISFVHFVEPERASLDDTYTSKFVEEKLRLEQIYKNGRKKSAQSANQNDADAEVASAFSLAEEKAVEVARALKQVQQATAAIQEIENSRMSDEEESARRANPLMPAALPRTGLQDFSAIDHLILEEVLYGDNIVMLKSIPKQYREQWAHVNVDIVRSIQESEKDSAEYTRGLKWWLVKHKILLRMGANNDQKALGRRFKWWEEGDFQSLIRSYEDDSKIPRRTRKGVDNSDAAKARSAHNAAADGSRKKAARFLDASNLGIAETGEGARPEVIQQLDDKHGSRQKDMIGWLKNADGSAFDGGEDFIRMDIKGKLFRAYRRLLANSGKGPSGESNAYLKALAQHFVSPKANKAIGAHEWMAEQYLNADLPAWFYSVTSNVTMMALIKSEASSPELAPDVRPVAIGEVWRRAVVSTAVKQYNIAIGASYKGLQVAVGVADGSAKLLAMIRGTMEANPDFVLVKIDLKNAYNEACRMAVLNAMLKNPATRKFAPYFHAAMSPKSKIFGINALSESGVQQGAPDATFEFTTVIQEEVEVLHSTIAAAGGAVEFFSDDGYAGGPADVVFDALNAFEAALFERTGLKLSRNKCQVYSSNPSSARTFHSLANAEDREHAEDSDYKLGALPDVDTATAAKDAGFGITVLGIPYGDNEYKMSRLDRKVKAIGEDISNQTRILNSERPADLQLSQNILLSCRLSRFDYWLQHMPPHETTPFAIRVDEMFLRVLGDMAKQDFLSMHGGEDNNIIRRLRLPIRFFGAGLDGKAALAPVAYAAMWVKVLRSLRDRVDGLTGTPIPGFSNELWDLLCTRDDGNSYSSGIENFIDGHSELGNDFRDAYERTQLTALSPKHGPLAIKIEEIAEEALENVLRRPQQAYSSILNEARHDRLHKDFLALPKNDHSRLAWLNTTSRSSAFLRMVVEVREETRAQQDVMSHETVKKYEFAMCDWELETMWALFLGLKISWLEPFVGQKIGSSNRLVDAYGAQLMACQGMTGGHWTKRHDKYKDFLYDLMKWAGMCPKTEVRHEFSRYISTNVVPENQILNHVNQEQTQQDLFNGLSRKKQEGYVPDLGGKSDTAMPGSKRRFLGEVKTVNGQRSGRYLKANDNRLQAVANRGKSIDKDIWKRMKELDRDFNGTDFNVGGGPCEVHLRSKFGKMRELVFGAFGEWSVDVDILISHCTRQIAKNEWMYSGFRCENDACHILKQYVLKRLGVLSLRAVAVLLSDLRDQIGIGDNKENMKHVKGARRLADIAARDHAHMMRAFRF